jgi:hypothetical protein
MKAISQVLHPVVTLDRANSWSRFLSWSEAQDDERMLWSAFGLVGHGCLFAPISILVSLVAGVNIFLFMAVIVSMGAVLVSNLAAMSTRYTIPVFFASLVVNAAVIITSIVRIVAA